MWVKMLAALDAILFFCYPLTQFASFSTNKLKKKSYTHLLNIKFDLIKKLKFLKTANICRKRERKKCAREPQRYTLMLTGTCISEGRWLGPDFCKNVWFFFRISNVPCLFPIAIWLHMYWDILIFDDTTLEEQWLDIWANHSQILTVPFIASIHFLCRLITTVSMYTGDSFHRTAWRSKPSKGLPKFPCYLRLGAFYGFMFLHCLKQNKPSRTKVYVFKFCILRTYV